MNRIQWERHVPIYRNRFILGGVAYAIGIPFAAILIIVTILSKGDILGTDAKYVFGMMGMFFSLCALLILTMFCRKFASGFIVDEEGIVNYSQQKQAKKNKLFNIFLIVFGLFRGSYTPVGTGFMPLTKPVMKIEWKNIRKIRYFPKQFTILVQSGFMERIVLFCTKENYEAVGQVIREKMATYSKI